MRYMLLATCTIAALVAAPAVLHAQQSTADQNAQTKPMQSSAQKSTLAGHPGMFLINKDAATRVEPVAPDSMYKGWRAESLLNQVVHGSNNQDLGTVRDILVGADGVINAVVVEGGGFLGIGDASFRIAWNKVDLTPSQDGIKVAITENKAENLGLFDRPEWIDTGPREWRVTELIGDYARLDQGQGFGYVTDLVFSKDAKLQAVLVNRDVTYGAGVYGYPFYGWGYGWTPGLSYYALPYDTADAAIKLPVSYDKFDHAMSTGNKKSADNKK